MSKKELPRGGGVHIAQNLKKVSQMIDRRGNVINPRTGETIEKNEEKE